MQHPPFFLKCDLRNISCPCYDLRKLRYLFHSFFLFFFSMPNVLLQFRIKFIAKKFPRGMTCHDGRYATNTTTTVLAMTHYLAIARFLDFIFFKKNGEFWCFFCWKKGKGWITENFSKREGVTTRSRRKKRFRHDFSLQKNRKKKR